MKRRRLIRPIQSPLSGFAGFRFPPEVILIAVRWYLRYGLSYRDLEELLAERGIEVDHVTLFRWVQRFTPILVEAAKPCRHMVGSSWFVDETYVKVSGSWRYVYRALDQYGQVWVPKTPSNPSTWTLAGDGEVRKALQGWVRMVPAMADNPEGIDRCYEQMLVPDQLGRSPQILGSPGPRWCP